MTVANLVETVTGLDVSRLLDRPLVLSCTFSAALVVERGSAAEQPLRYSSWCGVCM